MFTMRGWMGKTKQPAKRKAAPRGKKATGVALDGRGRFLVTGGAGFIGSVLVGALNRWHGTDRVVVVDQLGTDDKWRNLSPLRFEEFVEADEFYGRLERKAGAFGDFTHVFHLGACSSTTERDADYLLRNNFGCSRQLAEWALRRGARFVYASSAATYGDGSAGMDDSSDDLAAWRPLNAYGYSKQLFDLHAQREGYLQRIVGLKYFNIFGPNEEHKGEMRSVVSKAWRQIEETGQVKLFKSYHPDYPDGGQKRDFLYVKDAVAMTLHLAAAKQSGGLFNIGSGEAHTWLELVHPIFEAMGREARVEFIDMPEALRGQYQYFTQAEITKLQATGYAAGVTPLAAAVKDYVGNYLMGGKHFGDGVEDWPVAADV
jgi:ADP-L-glycero-D-manno-heptose 6-epimerase